MHGLEDLNITKKTKKTKNTNKQPILTPKVLVSPQGDKMDFEQVPMASIFGETL